MLIYCPKCKQGYELKKDMIPEEGRKLRCSSCGEIFKFDRNGETAVVEEPVFHASVTEIQNESENLAVDVVETEVVDDNIKEQTVISENQNNSAEVSENTEETAVENVDEPVDINDIFKRLSEQTENLFEKEKKLLLRERLWLKFKTLTGWNLRLKIKYVIVFLVMIVVISLYNNRYDIARKFPWTASVYGLFGIESQILGEGLEFQNIDWVYYDDGDAPRLEIKGFINNKTRRNIKIPIVHVEMLDENTNLLKSQNQQLKQEILRAKGRLPLNIVVTQPSPTTKYVFLTFVKND